jgi:hypothetical protein
MIAYGKQDKNLVLYSLSCSSIALKLAYKIIGTKDCAKMIGKLTGILIFSQPLRRF